MAYYTSVEHVPTAARFQIEAPLFANPATGRPYSAQKLRALWIDACAVARVPYVPLYWAMKHTSLTALAESGVAKDDLRALARHRDECTTDGYPLEDDHRRRRALEQLEALEQSAPKRRSSVTQLRTPVRDTHPDGQQPDNSSKTP